MDPPLLNDEYNQYGQKQQQLEKEEEDDPVLVSRSSVVAAEPEPSASASAAADDDEDDEQEHYHSLPEYPQFEPAPKKANVRDDNGDIVNKRGKPCSAIMYLRAFLVAILLATAISSAFWVAPEYYRGNPLSAYGETQVCVDHTYERVDDWGKLPCYRGVENKCGLQSGQSPIDIQRSYCIDDRCAGDNAVQIIKDSSTASDGYDANVCTLNDLTSKLLADVSAKTYYTFANASCEKPMIRVENEDWELSEMQFHTGGSEHTIEETRFEGELHLIHQKASSSTGEDSSSSSSLIIAIPLTTKDSSSYYYDEYYNNRRRKLQGEDEENDNNDGEDGDNNEEVNDGDDNNDNDQDDENDRDGDDENDGNDENDRDDENDNDNNDQDDEEDDRNENNNNDAEDEVEDEQEVDYDDYQPNEEQEEEDYDYENNHMYYLEPLLVYYEAISSNLADVCGKTSSVRERKSSETLIDSNYMDHSNVDLDDKDYYYYAGNNGANNIMDIWSPYSFIPANTGVYMYEGSFTTPPCESGVKWIVMDTPLLISEYQMQRLDEIVSSVTTPKWPSCVFSEASDSDDEAEKHSTYRPIQSRSSKAVDHECTFLSSE